MGSSTYYPERRGRWRTKGGRRIGGRRMEGGVVHTILLASCKEVRGSMSTRMLVKLQDTITVSTHGSECALCMPDLRKRITLWIWTDGGE
jgi:hypothetical protein